MNTLPLSGITLLGVLGESARLSDIEKRNIIDFVSTLDNSLPVIYGVNSYSPYVSEELAKYAQDKPCFSNYVVSNERKFCYDR